MQQSQIHEAASRYSPINTAKAELSRGQWWRGVRTKAPLGGLADGAHPPTNVTHVSPLNVCLFPARKGAERGKSAIIILQNMQDSNL